MKLNVSVKDMARGYMEMAEINLEIANECFHLENEGARYYEMVAEKGEDNATA